MPRYCRLIVRMEASAFLGLGILAYPLMSLFSRLSTIESDLDLAILIFMRAVYPQDIEYIYILKSTVMFYTRKMFIYSKNVQATSSGKYHHRHCPLSTCLPSQYIPNLRLHAPVPFLGRSPLYQ
jgi:hypothetical protein